MLMGVVDHRALNPQPVTLRVLPPGLRRLLASASGDVHRARHLGAGKTQRPAGRVILLPPPQRRADREDRPEGLGRLLLGMEREQAAE